MKTHYYSEIGLLIALSIATTSLAIDSNFFAALGFENSCINDLSIFKIFAFLAVVVISAINIFKYLHSEKKLIHSLVISVHNVFFKKKDIADSCNGKIYRVTCYKYYKFWIDTFWFILILIAHISVLIVVWLYLTNRDFCNLKLIVSLSLILGASFSILLLYFIDNWWFHCLKRLFIPDRRLTLGKNYLLSYARLQYENGKRSYKNTTIPVLIDEKNKIYRLFSGKVFKNKENDYDSSLNNHNINSILKRIKANMGGSFKKVNAGFKVIISDGIEKNINELKSETSFRNNNISDKQRDEVTKFMNETNTLAFDLFSINEIKHSNHFVGFKIFNGKDSKWGVVVVDALGDDEEDFFKYLEIDPEGPNTPENNQMWLNLVLQAFSEIFSRAIHPKTKESDE